MRANIYALCRFQACVKVREYKKALKSPNFNEMCY